LIIPDMSRTLPPPGATAWDFPRSAAGVRHLVAYAERAGLPVEPLLVGSGLRVEDLDRVQVVTAAQELRVVRALARLLPDSGADVGRRYTAASFGVMGWAMRASATLGEAVGIALSFIDLSFAFVIPQARLEGETGEERVVAELDATALPRDVRRWLLERDATAVATVLTSLVPGGVGLVQVVEGDRATLTFPARELDRPLVRERGADHAAAAAACQALALPRRERTGVVADVRVLVAQRLREGAPMAEVAAALGVTERTLRRRLAAEGTGYRALVEEVRSGLAAELLAVGLPVADVAARLGYAETAPLTRAHRRWTGRPPSAAR
jgi:AraC-like DNA-binding protein